MGVTLGNLCCDRPCGIPFESEGCPSSRLSLELSGTEAPSWVSSTPPVTCQHLTNRCQKHLGIPEPKLEASCAAAILFLSQSPESRKVDVCSLEAPGVPLDSFPPQ